MAAVLRRICVLRLPKIVRPPHLGTRLPFSWLQNASAGCLVAGQSPAGCCHLFSSQRNDGEVKQPRPKTVPKPMVTLLGPDKGAVVVVLMEEAEKIAKRRDLRLEKVSEADSKSGRATYKLLSHSGQLKKDATDIKGANRIAKHDHKEKQLLLTDKISANDLQSKIKQLKKWTEKRSDTRVIITGANAETVYQVMEKELASVNARLLQKRVKGENLKFTVQPPKEAKESIEDNIKTAE